MADPKQPADLKRWHELATKERKGADPAGLVWHTPEGIDVKPLYTAADVAGLDFTDSAYCQARQRLPERLVADVARRTGQGPVAARELAEAERLPQGHLDRLDEATLQRIDEVMK